MITKAYGVRHPRKNKERRSEYYRGYGFDTVSEKVREQIKSSPTCPQASTYFVAGGTLTNLLACSAFLRPFESIIATIGIYLIWKQVL